MTTTTPTSDKLRVAAVVISSITQVLAPLLGPAFGQRPSGEISARYPTIITPPDRAFAIWFPIYAGCAASAVQQARPEARTTVMNRRTGWLLTGAYTANTVWALVEQRGRFKRTALILPVVVTCTAAVYGRLQSVEATSADGVTPSSTGLLLGWTSLAAVVNVAAAARAAGYDQTSPPVVTASTAAILATGAVVAAVVSGSRRGFTATAAAATWGLANVATGTSSTPVRIAAILGATSVATAAGAKWRRRLGAFIPSQN